MAGTEWLSEGAEKLAFALLDGQGLHCDIAIVGSGYGGAVAAARLAGAKEPGGATSQVWVLERGREHLPGSFPERFADLPGQVRFSAGGQPRTRGRAEGLFDLRIGEDVSALLGNGLGGGSLINAGVLARPRAELLEGERWPANVTAADLDGHFREAERMLGGTRLPGEAPAKLKALGRVGRHLGQAAERPSIAVTFHSNTITGGGVTQEECVDCGDCFTGCNHWAKNTLAMNYLPLAQARGARLFTGVTVLSLGGEDGAWELEVEFTDPKLRERFGTRMPKLRARRAVLAAGAYGSTGILLRSARRGFQALSGELGKRFSTNGDMIAAGYRMPERVNASAHESQAPVKDTRKIGPTITGMIDLRGRPVPLAIEELAIPAALRRPLEEIVTTFAALHDLARIDTSRHGAGGSEELDPAAIDPRAIESTAIYATIGEDRAEGVLALSEREDVVAGDGGLVVKWPGVGSQDVFVRAIELLQEAHDACGATLLPNPLWRALPQKIGGVLDDDIGGSVLTVHPLGGCPMADDAQDGVVNEYGQVYCSGRGTGVHDTLVVLDGAIVPSALGTNPCLTIAALAERAVPELARRWGVQLVRTPVLPRPRPPGIVPQEWRGPGPTGLRLAERLEGPLQLAYRRPGAIDYPGEFDAELELAYEPIADMERFLAQGSKSMAIRRARLSLKGEVEAGAGETNWSGTVNLAEGELKFLERESSVWWQRILRAGWAWLFNRGLRDLTSALAVLLKPRRLLRRAARPGAILQLPKLIWQAITGWLAVASQAGEVRRMIYRFTVAEDLTVRVGDAEVRLLEKGDVLLGVKRLAYIAGVFASGDTWPSPWDQMTRLPLLLKRRGAQRAVRLGVLAVDLPYFVQHHATQLQIAAQDNQPRAIADLCSFVAFLARVIGKIHIWSFRAPDYPDPYPVYEFAAKDRDEAQEAALEAGVRTTDRLQHRLPGEVRGLCRSVQPLAMSAGDAQLTRYRSEVRSPDPALGPVLLIHGLGASGNTFTLPTVQQNLVQHLALRGFDPWVLDLRTSIGLPSSKREWSFENVAREDIPAALRMVERDTGKPVNVVAHCIGAAMFCMSALEGHLRDLGIRAAVLSQVGPLLELPATNRFRGYVASYLKHYLDIGELDTTASLTAFNRFLDRLLAAYPYPRDEWLAHRPLVGRVEHEAYCIRAYGIYGRLFEHRNLNHETLEVLGDYLGHIRYRTYQQTIFYATMRRLTDQAGRNAYVTSANVAAHLNFPVCLLHGALNEVFHVRTSRRSFDLLASVFWPEDLQRIWDSEPERRYAHDAYMKGERLRLVEIPGYGHQDCMIGKRAHEEVYPAISDFLAQDFGRAARAVQPQFVVRPPRLGPVVGWVRRDPNQKRRRLARLLFAPNDSRSEPCYAMSIVLRDGATQGASFHSLRRIPAESQSAEGAWPATQAIDVALPELAADYIVVVVTIHREHYEPEPLREAGEPPVDDPFGEDLDRFPTLPAGLAFPEDPASVDAMPFAEAVLETCKDLDLRRVPLPTGGCVADRRYATATSAAILSRDVLAVADDDAKALRFSLASCRYAANVTDREAADASFGRLRERLERRERGRAPQLLVLTGDAVYADATYGIFDPTLGVERYDQRYLEAWTAPHAREVLRRVPVLPMLDDHEIEENYDGVRVPLRRSETVEAGLDAFESFQLRLTPAFRDPAQPSPEDARYAYTARAGGFGFFVMDTRSERERGRGRACLSARIVSERQMQRLKAWLDEGARAEPNLPKFVVSPSVVAPWSLQTCGAPAYALRSDAWDGFPESLHELLAFIARNRIRNVVFLSGDFHCSLFCEMALTHGSGQPVPAYSIVSSGLYSPYPFANTRMQDLECHFNDGLDRRFGAPGMRDLHVTYEVFEAGPADSFAFMDVAPAGMTVEFRSVGFRIRF
ncbi:MAG TPA: alkaline phosphatase D family protein [Burkholderiales bacterium]